MTTKKKKQTTKIKELEGFVLFDAHGTPMGWYRESTRAITMYALAKKRLILSDDDYEIERERLEAEGWSIKAATITIALTPLPRKSLHGGYSKSQGKGTPGSHQFQQANERYCARKGFKVGTLVHRGQHHAVVERIYSDVWGGVRLNHKIDGNYSWNILYLQRGSIYEHKA